MRRIVMALVTAAGLTAALGAVAPAQDAPADAVEAARQKYLGGAYAEGFREIFPYARQGNAVAQNVVANAYFYGNGVVQDCKLALKWTQAAADQGLDRAMHNLGAYRDLGCFGAGLDAAEAARWYRKAIDAGFLPSHARLARLIASGRTGTPDPAAIRAVLDPAIAAGDADAVLALAELQFRGEGVPRDRAAAAASLRALALHANKAAVLLALARFHLEGIDDTGPDLPAAEALLRKLVEVRHAEAGPDLARLMIEGGGWWQDRVQGWATCTWARRNAAPDTKPPIDAACEALRPLVPTDELIRAALVAARMK
jgi:TPR repeat protein